MTEEQKNGEVVHNPALDVTAPAIVVRMTIPPMEVQFAVPLDMTLPELNRYVDKVTSIAERQRCRAQLETEKLNLETAMKNLAALVSNRSMYEVQAEQSWVDRGRKGAWKADGAQSAALRNYEKDEHRFRDEVIPHTKKIIEELEAKINKDV